MRPDPGKADDTPRSPIPSCAHLPARPVYDFQTAEPVMSAFGVPTDAVIVYECPGTGLRFRPPPPADELARLHEGQYQDFYAGADPDDGAGTDAHAAACREEWRARAEGLHALRPGGRVLDVGCSTGILMGELAALGFDAHGCDVSAAACAQAAEQLGADRVFHGAVPALAERFPPEYFDAATLMDVIEHFEAPLPHLRAIHALLKPDGVLLLRTPVLSSPFFKIADWSHALTLGRYKRAVQLAYHAEHIYFFTRKGLEQLLADAGFDVISATPDPLFWKTFSTAELRHGPLVNTALAAVYWASRLMGGGHGVMVAARKRA